MMAKSKKKRSIWLLFAHYYFSTVLLGIEEKARARGCRVMQPCFA